MIIIYVIIHQEQGGNFMAYILDDYSFVKNLDEIFENLKKRQPREKILSEEEKNNLNAEIKEMQKNLFNYSWWAENYPDEFGELFKKLKDEEKQAIIKE